MDWSWLNPSLVVAVLALWIARANYRRSNYAVVRLRDCSISYRTLDLHRVQAEPRLYGQLRVVIQNLGIPLHNLQMCLCYTGKDGSGQFTLPLRATGKSNVREGQFAKGMMTEFSLSSHELDRGDVTFLLALQDTRKQSATLCLYADGYLAWEYQLNGVLDPIKRRWNRLASKVNRRATRRTGTNAQGQPIIRQYTVLPAFAMHAWNVQRFADDIRKEHAPPHPQQNAS